MPSDWQEINNSIVKKFNFKNFREALDFVNKIGDIAEKLNHHPDILLYGYKNVRIISTTHAAGKVTDKDWELAKQIDLS